MARRGAGSSRGSQSQKKAATAAEPEATPEPQDDGDTDRTPFRNRIEGERFLAEVAKIAPNPRNVREDWEWEDDPDFDDLVGNIERLGQLQDPTVIRRARFRAAFPEDDAKLPPDAEWVIGTGERRYRAAVRLKQKTLPVVLAADKLVTQMDEVLWSENQSRKGLDPIQEGVLFLRLRDGRPGKDKMKLEQIAEELGSRGGKKLSTGEISKKIQLAKRLPDGPVRRAVRTRQLGVEPAYTLLTKLRTPDRVAKAYALIEEKGVTAEKAVELLAPAPQQRADKGQPDAAPASRKAGKGQTDPAPLTTDPAIPGQNSGPSDKADGAQFSATKTGEERWAALVAVLGNRTYQEPHDALTQRLARALVRHAPDDACVLAVQALEQAEVTLSEGPWEGAELLRVADAVALVCAELRLLNLADLPAIAWGAADAAYIQSLVTEGGYTPTAEETARIHNVTEVQQ
ncbi:ParB/RepB/Spo0J family partition protein [Streptomyces sp. Ac-502]|uniref:ParB/RepB/Spo0J family partition protein n=1 Tax=Streptomyces sp. Ac-502 TaxID=3342801 RepID=UPI00386280CF